jgi:hypothetical protein
VDSNAFTQFDQHRQGQKPVRDRAAKRRFGGGFLINVDELMIFGAISEIIDALLVEGNPITGT